jgi:predicted nucleic acid-binding protein
VIVADASVVVEFLLGSARGTQVAPKLMAEEGAIFAPALIDAEVAQTVRRLAGAGVISEARGGATIELLQDLPLERRLITPLLPRIWQLRHNLSAYDATYVSLAEALDCPLLTFDQGLADAPGHAATVIVGK